MNELLKRMNLKSTAWWVGCFKCHMEQDFIIQQLLSHSGIFPSSIIRLLHLTFLSINCTEHSRQPGLKESLRGYHYSLPASGILFLDCQSQWQIISPQSLLSTAFLYHFFFHVTYESLLPGKSFMWHFIKCHFMSLII